MGLETCALDPVPHLTVLRPWCCSSWPLGRMFACGTTSDCEQKCWRLPPRLHAPGTPIRLRLPGMQSDVHGYDRADQCCRPCPQWWFCQRENRPDECADQHGREFLPPLPAAAPTSVGSDVHGCQPQGQRRHGQSLVCGVDVGRNRGTCRHGFSSRVRSDTVRVSLPADQRPIPPTARFFAPLQLVR